jgi:cobalt-precorrin 5A hydrolase/precorrin-3B C17-methyltransferase
MRAGWVTFAGAGPGAVDLLTLRCRDAIAGADVIVYAGSLVNPDVLAFARPDAERHDSAGLTLEQTTAILVAACRAGKKALRLHTGDPSVYGAIAEQIVELERAGIGFEVIPGVSSVFAAAASLGCELTLPGASQTVILARRAGRTPVPEGQDIRSLAAHRATMALFLSMSDMPGLVAELTAGGYPAATPVAVVYRASWPDERTVRGTLADIAARVASAGMERQALVLVGDALSVRGERSRLYAPEFGHGYRASGRRGPGDPPLREETILTRSSTLEGGRLALRSPTCPAKLEERSRKGEEGASARHEPAPFLGRTAVYGLTADGCALARRIGRELHADVFVSRKHAAPDDACVFEPERLGELLAEHWNAYDAHALVMACGIAVRKIAPLLRDKTTDPAVVVCDEQGQFAVSLVGGHIGGANRLSRRIADALGAAAVVTTATDAQGIPAFDEIAARQGWHIVNPPAIKIVNGALLQKQPIAFVGPADAIERFYGPDSCVRSFRPGEALPEGLAAVVALDADVSADTTAAPVLRLLSTPLVVGIGCRRHTSAEEIAAAVDAVLAEYGLPFSRVSALASAAVKHDEAGLLAFAERRRLAVKLFQADELAAVNVPTPSAMPARHVGTPSVAEAAALLGSGGRLLAPKQVLDKVTVSVAASPLLPPPPSPLPPSPPGRRIYAVGIGSGSPDSLTSQARQALHASDVIVGYNVYVEQVASLTAGKRILASGMRQEVQRCREAIEKAAAGRTVAVVCSGDAGVYGMAGLLLELLAEGGHDDVDLVVIPGVTSALGAAAALGAPLMNDFAVVSLSDLLTRRETIVERLRAVAASGVPCVLYNPRSRKRTTLLDEALRIFADAGGRDLACGFVRNAGRPDETMWIGRIGEFPAGRVDMFTTVILGGRETEILNGRLVTRRGYEKGGRR